MLGLLFSFCCTTTALTGGRSHLPPQHSSPLVLAFPERGLDDSAAYQGYQTRFYHDAAGNTVQIYLDARSGRVVHLFADADDESIGLTVRDAAGQPATLAWAGTDATVSTRGRLRTLSYALVGRGSRIELGLFLLGSMRVERDFQYADRHRQPFTAPPFALPEISRLIDALDKLPAAERQRQLALLDARSTSELQGRRRPTITTAQRGSRWIASVVQPSLDARDTLAIEIQTDARRVLGTRAGDVVTLASRSGGAIPFTLLISTTGKALTPLTRKEIFAPRFLGFLAAAHRSDPTSTRARWLERQVRGVELLSSHEKLMAGLPAYATYFGRDMIVSALMMQPIWRDDMSAFAIASALRKLGPGGEVSHEEALGAQAEREAADEYAHLVDAYLGAQSAGNEIAADSLLARARSVLRDHRRVRENYHMIDNIFQLPVLEARWLGDAAVTPGRKRAFLLDATDGEARVRRMLRELSLVSRLTAPYVVDPVATNLVRFPPLDSTHCRSASWRDSNEGYAGGCFAMDVNAIWVPHALESIDVILRTLRSLGIAPDSLLRAMRADDSAPALASYARDRSALGHAIDVWQGAQRHFLVSLAPADVRSHVTARLAALPDNERRYWSGLVAATNASRDSLAFLALSLDDGGHAIAVANSDPSTRLFLLRDSSAATRPDVLRDIRLFVRPYPVGLFIAGVGPVVANDAYAPAFVWPQFERDRYHGPRVVWGREVNLFLLGVMNQLATTRDTAYTNELRDALQRVRAAAEASGFHSELWSYEVRSDGSGVDPIRYGTGSDVQLWSTTDLAVQYALSALKR